MTDNILYLNNYFADYFLPINLYKEDSTSIPSQEKDTDINLQKTEKFVCHVCNNLV